MNKKINLKEKINFDFDSNEKMNLKNLFGK